MIDLKNTYIEDKEGELKYLWISECIKQGITDKYNQRNESNSDWIYLEVYDNVICGSDTPESESREITLADLKPDRPKRVKVSYEKVNQNKEDGLFWHCARDLSEGNCQFYTNGIHELQVTDTNVLLANYKAGLLYRKVESEITWQREMQEFVNKSKELEWTDDLSLTGSGVEWDNEFITMCHFVAEMTDKPR